MQPPFGSGKTLPSVDLRLPVLSLYYEKRRSGTECDRTALSLSSSTTFLINPISSPVLSNLVCLPKVKWPSLFTGFVVLSSQLPSDRYKAIFT